MLVELGAVEIEARFGWTRKKSAPPTYPWPGVRTSAKSGERMSTRLMSKGAWGVAVYCR